MLILKTGKSRYTVVDVTRNQFRYDIYKYTNTTNKVTDNSIITIFIKGAWYKWTTY